jgi:tRNA (adenine22-N1)-methyltransferase
VVAGFIENGASVVDVGTDHGLLPVFLARNGLARNIVASDISEGSLAAARRSAAKYGVTEKIKFVAAPGLKGAQDTDVDTVVIAGVGGETIIRILADAPWVKSRGARLILQPQTKSGELCRWLRDNGYAIRDAELVRDSGRFYTVMLVGAGESGSARSPEMELLLMLRERRGPLFAAFIDKLIAKTKQTSDGMEKSGSAELQNMLKKLEELNILKEDDLCRR